MRNGRRSCGVPAREKLFAMLLSRDVRHAWGTRPNVIQEYVARARLVVSAAGRICRLRTSTTPLGEVLRVELCGQIRHRLGRPSCRSCRRTPAASGPRSDAGDTPRRTVRPGASCRLVLALPVTKLRPGHPRCWPPRLTIGDQPMPLVSTHSTEVRCLPRRRRDGAGVQRPREAVRPLLGAVVYQIGLPHLLGNAARVQIAPGAG